MKLNIATEIVTAGEQEGHEIQLSKDYSGRGMFGKGTAAVIVAGIAEWSSAVARAVVNSSDPDAIVAEVGRIRTDSLGHDMVIY